MTEFVDPAQPRSAPEDDLSSLFRDLTIPPMQSASDRITLILTRAMHVHAPHVSVGALLETIIRPVEDVVWHSLGRTADAVYRRVSPTLRRPAASAPTSGYATGPATGYATGQPPATSASQPQQRPGKTTPDRYA